jgi:glyoxylase-like metal-dependent hydrolase (beta-lactamase superfamily II)
VILEQYYLGCLAHASYLIADEQSRTAAVVDPQRDVDQYLRDARRLGVCIRHVLLTHFHADFVAGHLELRDRAGATIYLGSRARAEYEFVPLGGGGVVELGPEVRLEAVETPGHSPESISILVHDLTSDRPGPYAVLTGDTLFIGDVGRPDLRASLGWSAEALGATLYDSLRDKLLTLPDETLVYPAHGAGSLCGKNLSTETVSTIGAQRLDNYALQPMSRDEFVAIVTADQPDTPPYFTYDAVLNARERPTLEEALERELRPLSLEAVLALRREGAQVLDTREPADFEAAHFEGSVLVGLGGSYATWCGTVLDRDRPVVLVCEPGREQEAATSSVASDSTSSPAISMAACWRSSGGRSSSRTSSGSPPERWPSSSNRRSRRSCSTCERSASGARSGSTAASTSRSAGWRSGSTGSRTIVRWSSTARPATGRRSAPASFSATASPRSAISWAGSLPGRGRSAWPACSIPTEPISRRCAGSRTSPARVSSRSAAATAG